MDNERLPAAGFESWYTIDRQGNVFHLDGTPKATEPRKGGYRALVRYFGGGKRKRKSLHCVLYETFVGAIQDGTEIDHIDRNPGNNAIENLRIVTRSNNRANSTKRFNASHSRYIGVIDSGGAMRGTGTRFRGRVKKDGKCQYTKVYRCETAAAIARDRIAIKVFGDNASLNFPTLFGRDQPSAANQVMDKLDC